MKWKSSSDRSTKFQTRSTAGLEDEEIVRKLVERILLQLNYEVVSFSDPEAGLAASRSSAVPFDLLITDVVMPKLDGKEVAEQLRALFPDLGVMKPFSKDVIGATVNEMLSARRAGSTPQQSVNVV